jgi:hypothetical protein
LKITKGDYLKEGYVSFDDRLLEPYRGWEKRRKERGLYVPQRKHEVC